MNCKRKGFNSLFKKEKNAPTSVLRTVTSCFQTEYIPWLNTTIQSMAQTTAVTAAASTSLNEEYSNSSALSEHLTLDTSPSQQQQQQLQLTPDQQLDQLQQLQPLLQQEAAYRDDGRLHQSSASSLHRPSSRTTSNYTEPKYYLGKLQTSWAKPVALRCT